MRKLLITELNRLSLEEFRNIEKIPVTVVLDNIRSLSNVGSIFRTCDALRLEQIILCGITATPPHNEIHKTALGAEDSMKWSYSESTLGAIQILKSANYSICSIEQVHNSTSLLEFKPVRDQKYALVFGNEVKGVQQEVVNNSDYCIEIPQFGTKHSFNVAVSAGIVLWEFFKNLQ